MNDSDTIDQLIDTLRHRPVATTAAQMRHAAIAIEALRAERDLLAKQAAILQPVVNAASVFVGVELNSDDCADAEDDWEARLALIDAVEKYRESLAPGNPEGDK